MRYERLAEILRLATHLQGSPGGLTTADIQEEFSVSRRTAERMRDAVEAVFGPLETVDVETGDRRIRWRLRSRALHPFVQISPDELADIEAAAGSLGNAGLAEGAGKVRDLAVKLRAASRRHSPEEFHSALTSLMEAEGLAMRAGPRECLEEGLLSLVRDAITARRKIEFDYLSRGTGRRRRRRVRPYGVLYGNRAFLVGRTDRGKDPMLWRLANVTQARITDETFEREPAFNLRRYAERSFGTFQEKPVDVVLRFDADVAPDAKAFRFHPSQTTIESGDGSLTVRFRAGGTEEICWHLVTWGESVTVLEPSSLRQRLAAMCSSLAAHHREQASQ
ncbi:MAG: WYL domain-containing protein [Deltaproteobacteria bacterium]|nr:WYL domain-containing protein [Deltaproteobacteria bacterium]